MIGVDVIGSDIARLGEVKEVLVDAGGTVSGVVVATGGVLGVGARDIALPYGAFLWNYAAAPTDRPRSSKGHRRRCRAGPAGGAAAPGPRRRPRSPARSAIRRGRRRACGPRSREARTGDGAPVTRGPAPTREDLRAAPAFEGSR